MDAGTRGDKDAELPQGPRALAVGKEQANLARQHRTPQIYLHRPLIERVVEIGLPEGCRIAIDNQTCRLRIALGLPDPAGHLAALLRWMAKVAGVGHGVDLLAELGQPQFAVGLDLHQIIGHLPSLPRGRAVEAERIGPYRSDSQDSQE